MEEEPLFCIIEKLQKENKALKEEIELLKSNKKVEFKVGDVVAITPKPNIQTIVEFRGNGFVGNGNGYYNFDLYDVKLAENAQPDDGELQFKIFSSFLNNIGRKPWHDVNEFYEE